MREVKVTWTDIFFQPEGDKESCLKLEPAVQTTYGQLLRNDEVVTVVSTVDEDGNFFRDIVVIPKAVVKEIKDV